MPDVRNFYSPFLVLFVSIGLWIDHANGQLPGNPIGNNSPELKWFQVNTDQVKVIFPEHLDSTAQRIARIIQQINQTEDKTITKSNLKPSIVLQGQAANSNGFVTVGPFRSEFFPSQRQFGNATDYIDLLTIHEYRHVQQFAQATQGITKTVKNVLGSWAWGGMMATALPRWYFEGDAVLAETQFSKTGRGRLPSFNMQYYALLNDGIINSYEKAGAGSIKDFVPDWYPLGYQILSYGRSVYGEDLWKHVADDAVRYKGVFYPFSRSLKKRTGLSSGDMYYRAMDSLQTSYQNLLETLELSSFEHVIKKKKKNLVVHQYLPKPHKSDLIFMEFPFDHLPRLVLKDQEGLQYLCETGIHLDRLDGTISVSDNYVIWSQLAFDPRWRYRQYNDIYKYHLPSQTKYRLTKKQRLHAPAIGPEEEKIAAIAIREDLTPSLAILSARTGELMMNLENHSYGQMAHPCWINDNEIVLVATKNEEAALMKVNLEESSWEPLTPFTSDQLSHPFYYKGSVYYSASYSGINNIYNMSISTGKIFKLTEVPVGAYQPSVSNDGVYLYYSELESNGRAIRRAKMDSLISEPFENQLQNAAISTKEYDHYGSIIDQLPDTTFEIKKFNTWSGILNPHSLIPVFTPRSVSLRLLSDNVFSTMSGQGGGTYNFNEDEWSYFVGLNYAELYPVINASFVHANRSAQFFNFSAQSDTTSLFTIFNQDWSENRISTGAVFPFNLSSGNMASRVNLGVNVQFANINLESNFQSLENFRDTLPAVHQFFSVYDDPIKSTSLTTLDLRLNAQFLKRKAPLHIQPRFGLAAAFRIRKQLSSNLSGGDVVNFDGVIYLPGFLSTHSFYVTTALQFENVLDNYRYSDLYEYSRGYDVSFRRDDFVKFGFNYSFPLYYPDKAIGPFAFIKRIKANMFYDYGNMKLNSGPFSSSENMQSLGLELGLDFRAFRLVEVDMGLRYSYLLNPEVVGNPSPHQFDFFVISITQ